MRNFDMVRGLLNHSREARRGISWDAVRAGPAAGDREAGRHAARQCDGPARLDRRLPVGLAGRPGRIRPRIILYDVASGGRPAPIENGFHPATR